MKLLFVVTLIFGFLTLGFCQQSLNCWVGYAYNGNLRGGSVPCDGGTCVHINGSYTGQAVNLFACEPSGVCTAGDHIAFAGFDAYCCQNADNCNTGGFPTPPPPSPLPSLPPPVICNGGLYINNKNISRAAPRMCYGNCASISANLSGSVFTLATCDPLALCDNLGLENSCHTMPQQILSGCCCNSNLCIDPVNNVQPTPPLPPPGSIKCFIGLQQDNQTPIGSETYCPGMCHSTSAMIGTSNYTVYACDRYQICEMFGIRPNRCGFEEGALQSCCCDSDNCNTPGNFTAPTVDPNPPIQAEHCFTGFQTSNIGPLGRSMECFGDCVTYSAGGLKIFGCDPVSVCKQLNATNAVGKFGALNVTCCSTPDCNYQASTTVTSCYNGITIDMPEHNILYSKAQSLPCKGRCATFSVAYKHLKVDVYTCDPYNICNLNSSDALKVNCCDSPNCNLNNNTIPVTTVAPMGRNISCFQGFQIRRGFPFGNQMTCDGACARVHIGQDTIYTCDPGDTCGDFGVDGCNMLFDGLTVCCCKGDRCNEPEREIRPAIKQNLTCFIGYGVGTAVSGGLLPCNGMCGKLTTTLNNVAVDAYLCLDLPLCTERDAYERCSHLQTDTAVKVCCCGGYDQCNYEPLNGTVLPPPPESRMVSCPQGLYVDGRAVYHTGTTITTCPNDCGLLSFNTTYGGQRVVNFAYYGCDPAAFCSQFSLQNSCGALGSSVSGCCCDSDLCMNPVVGRMTPVQSGPGAANLYCWVGYGNNDNLRGGTIPCDGGTCVHVNGTYFGQQVDIFACEPAGICTTENHLIFAGLSGWCCNDTNNCNANGWTIPVQPTPTPALPNPIVCYEGIYMNNTSLSTPVKKLCYGNCASVTGSLGNNTFTVATCDPLTLCDNLGLVNSCHQMPQKVISGCCCNSNLCIDPANSLQPTPPLPPPGSIKCFIGLQQDSQTPIGSETYCPGMCHSTSAMIGTSNYTVYACDRYQICEMFGIRPNRCGFEEGALQSCCCDSDNCNTPGNFTAPTVDPNPPIQAEHCFTGFQTSNIGPLGRSMECFGDCVTYSAGGLKIFGCDPISVCKQLNATNAVGKFGALNVTCCSTRDCNYQASTTVTSCFNGITINMPEHNISYSKAQSLPCKGRCATFSVAYKHLNVDVYTCDPYNICNLNSSDALKVNCCDSPNCNLNNNTIPVTTVAPMGRNISCFQGFQIRRGFPFGNQMTCDGACARVHIGQDTIYTCDPGDTCGDFGVDGCNMLFDGLTVCCCKGDRCNEPERIIRPAIKQNLNCFVGYGIGGFVSGGQLPCNGMCGKLTTTINATEVDAYLCLDLPICTERDAYERCGRVQTDMAVKVCCCGGYDHCNYEPMNSTVLPPPSVDNNVTCPQGLYVNGKNLYNTGNTVVTCPNSCGLMQFNTTFMQRIVNFAYYGCDPAAFCNKFSTVNSCGALGNSISGCCCDSDMCMNPLVGRMTPATTGTSLSCWVGYNYNNSLVGGSVPCDTGTCVHVNGTYSNQTVDVFACEPFGICTDGNHLALPGLDGWCCQDSNNCNAAGYTIPPPPSPAPSLPPPIICNEGLFMNNKSLSQMAQKLCYGDCASVSLAISNTTIFTVATCDPLTLCKRLNLNNSCHVMPQNILSGCCCNSNLCIDPINSVVPSVPPAQLNCWVGYNYNNSLVGGSVPCDTGTCVHVNGTYSNQTVDVFACEPFGICTDGNHLALPGLDGWCCQDSNNCNAAGYTIPPPPSPAPSLPPPIICNEGLFMNNKSLSQMAQKLCYGDCASVSLAISNTTTFTVATCDPLTLCKRLNLNNSCHVMPQNILSGCCCNSNLCIDPVNNILPSPPAPSADLTCWVGYYFNSTLRGGSIPCGGGTCVHINGTYSNQAVDVFACEPKGLCPSGGHLNVTGLDAWCCQDSNNCNAGGFDMPSPPPPSNTTVNPIVCNEGIYNNNMSISTTSKTLCYGECASVSLALSNTTTLTVATCDPLTLCQNLDLTNDCHVMPQNILSGCCCDTDYCIDPTKSLTVGSTQAPPVTGTTTQKASATSNTLSTVLVLAISFLFL